MRPPRKTLDIYCELRSRLRKGEFTGALPQERILAQEFNAARNTVRAALTMLEQGNFIVRKKGIGTFPTENARLEGQKVISILVPSGNYRELFHYPQFLQPFYQGVCDVAHPAGVAVEEVPVSRCNDPHRITFQFIDHFNDASLVAANGIWYKGVFDFLLRRKCTVAFIHHDAYPRYRANPGLRDIPQEFYLLTRDISSGIENAAAYITEQAPCRKLAYLAPYAEFRKENFRGYINALRYCTNQQELCFYNSEKLFPGTSTMNEFADFIRRWHHQEDFDGLIIRGGGKSQTFFAKNFFLDNAALGLPPEVRVVLGPMIYDNAEAPTTLPYFYFDPRRVGRLTAQTLLHPEISPRNRLIIPEFQPAPGPTPQQ